MTATEATGGTEDLAHKTSAQEAVNSASSAAATAKKYTIQEVPKNNGRFSERGGQEDEQAGCTQSICPKTRPRKNL